MEPERQSALLLIADGEMMNLRFEKETETWVARAVLPERDDLGATNLTFVVGSVSSPSSGTDARLLGIAFHELKIQPFFENDDTQVAPGPVVNGAVASFAIDPQVSITSEATLPRHSRSVSGRRAQIAAATD